MKKLIFVLAAAAAVGGAVMVKILHDKQFNDEVTLTKLDDEPLTEADANEANSLCECNEECHCAHNECECNQEQICGCETACACEPTEATVEEVANKKIMATEVPAQKRRNKKTTKDAA